MARLLLVLLIAVTLACGDRRATGPTPVTPAPDAVTSINVRIPSRLGLAANTVGIGLQSLPEAIATRGDGQTSDISQLVTWQSSDPTTVRIDNNRWVAGVSPGHATLNASYNGIIGSQNVTSRACVSWDVYAPSKIWLDQSVYFESHAYNACLIHWTTLSPTWSTLQPEILSLEATQHWPPAVKITGRHPGVAIVKAIASGRDADPLEHTHAITVLNSRRPPPEFLWFNINDPLVLGDSGRLQGEARWFDPIEWREDVAQNGYWKSSDRSVVVITPKGEFTARGVGAVIISVEFEGARRDITTRVVRP